MSGFDAGTYTLITYTGSLSDSGLTLGTKPSGKDYAIFAGNGSVTLTVTNSTVKPIHRYFSPWTPCFEGQLCVGNPSAEDDTDPADLTYTLVSGTGSTDNALFTIVKDIKTATVLDCKLKVY